MKRARNLFLSNRLMEASSLIVIAALASTSSANAQAAGEAAAAQEEDTVVLGRVTVTAQKREQDLVDVPLSLEVIAGDTLERAGINDSKDLFRIAPSVTYSEGFSSTSSSVAIRGVSSLAVEGGLQPSVVMIIDDVPFARIGEFTTDLADIERVEVLRGPQGTLVGKNSTAGALSIVTKRPSDTFGFGAEIQLTDETEQLYRGHVTGPITQNIRYRLNAYYRERDDFITNINSAGTGPDKIGGYDSTGIRGMLDIDFTPDVSLLLAADWRETEGSSGQLLVISPRTNDTARHLTELGYTPAFGRAIVNIDVAPLNKDQSSGYSADLNWNINENLSLRSITAYREFKNDSESDVDSTPFGSAASGALIQSFSLGFPRRPVAIDYWNQEIRLLGSYDRFNFVAGVFYNDTTETVLGQTPFAVPGFGIVNSAGVVDGAVENRTIAAFGDVSYDVTDRFGVFGGLRITNEEISYTISNAGVISPLSFDGTGAIDLAASRASYAAALANVLADPVAAGGVRFGDTIKDDQITGRIGATFKLAERQQLYVSYSTGYKGAGVNLARNSTNPNNATVEAETAESIEVGFKGSFLNDALYLAMSVYSQKIDNLQTSVVIPGTIDSELVNAGTLEAEGFELEINAALTEGLTLNSSLAYTEATTQGLVSTCYPGQLFVTGCTLGPDRTTPDGTSPTGFLQSAQDLSGVQAPSSPRFAFRVGAAYEWKLDSLPFDAYWQANYTWTDAFNTRLNNDPVSQIDDRSLLDVAIGIVDDDGRYEVSVFGRNLTNDFSYANIIENNGLIGRANGYLTRDAFRYYGVRFKLNY